MTTQDPIVIAGMARTPMGAFMGVYTNTSATELGATAVKGALLRSGLGAEHVQQVIMGCVLSAGLGQAPARQVSRGAGLPDGVASATVNKVCGSGMFSVLSCAQSLRLGETDFCVAGGMENMTRAPHLMAAARRGVRLGSAEIGDHIYTDGLNDAYSACAMGLYADETASKGGFSRETQDAFALRSLSRAQQATEQQLFSNEIVPVTVGKSSEPVSIDEPPTKAKPEKIPLLRPVFSPDGTVTAANASSISDGAAALIMTRQSVAKAHGLNTLAVIEGISQHAQSPETFTLAPIQAITKLLKATRRQASDIDLWEINEAFAVVTMAAIEAHSLNHDKVNVHGGACALGHPLGATGTRIMVSLLGAMRALDKEVGIASLCIGGGEAMAISLRLL